MPDLVTVKVKPGQSLAAPGGRLIRAGETVEVSRHEAEFFERMGAAEIVAGEPAAAAKLAKKGKNSPQSQ